MDRLFFCTKKSMRSSASELKKGLGGQDQCSDVAVEVSEQRWWDHPQRSPVGGRRIPGEGVLAWLPPSRGDSQLCQGTPLPGSWVTKYPDRRHHPGPAHGTLEQQRGPLRASRPEMMLHLDWGAHTECEPTTRSHGRDCRGLQVMQQQDANTQDHPGGLHLRRDQQDLWVTEI